MNRAPHTAARHPKPRTGRAVSIAIAFALAVSGCSRVPGLYDRSASNDDSPLPPPLQTDENGVVPDYRKDTSYPDLADVPEGAQPGTSAQERQQIADALVSDRDRAKYTDDDLRGGRMTSAPAPRIAQDVPAAPVVNAGEAVPAVPPPPVAQLPLPEVAAAPPPKLQTVAPPPAPVPPTPPVGGYVQAPPPSAPGLQVPPAGAAVAALPPQVAPPPVSITPQPVAPTAAPSRIPVPTPPVRTPTPPPAPRDTFVTPQAAAFTPPRPLSDLLDSQGGIAATIYFGQGSSRLGTRDRQKIREAVKAHEQRGGGIIRVLGHASSRTVNLSPREQLVANWRISQDRANAVADEILRLGVDPDTVLVEAVSDSEPVFYESMPAGEAGNRRAEIYLE